MPQLTTISQKENKKVRDYKTPVRETLAATQAIYLVLDVLTFWN